MSFLFGISLETEVQSSEIYGTSLSAESGRAEVLEAQAQAREVEVPDSK